MVAVCAGEGRCAGRCVQQAGAASARTRAGIAVVEVHPVMAVRYACSEHYDGEYEFVFDAPGEDCVVLRDGRTFEGEGVRNEDYHIWAQPVLAPFAGVVERITVNGVINTPGTLGRSRATSVVFVRDDGSVCAMHTSMGSAWREGIKWPRASLSQRCRTTACHRVLTCTSVHGSATFRCRSAGT